MVPETLPDCKIKVFLPNMPIATNTGMGTADTRIAGESIYCFSRFLAMKRALAGRSARRRMKYGYHSVPKGT